ncbi:MAG: tRNA (adenosine(37)-N6)-threonylcarbamoyltransferase complex ATPase subunit type 1 TsaE [Cyanobacteria bacterium P01_D01_bin.123]
MHSVICPSVRATQTLAAQIGKLAQPGTVLLLRGDLGGGKTTFTQGLGRGLGIEERIVSPTFTLIQEYEEGRIPLFHCDLYRLQAEDTFDLQLDEYCAGEGVTVIEWPDRWLDCPPTWLELYFRVVNDDTREIAPKAQGDYHEKLWERARARWKTILDNENDILDNENDVLDNENDVYED